MHIVDHALLPVRSAGGVHTRQLAAWTSERQAMSLALHVLEPGARLALAPGRHAATITVVLAGCGKLLLDGAPQRVAAACTASVPAGMPHEWVNNGTEALHLLTLAGD